MDPNNGCQCPVGNPKTHVQPNLGMQTPLDSLFGDVNAEAYSNTFVWPQLGIQTLGYTQPPVCCPQWSHHGPNGVSASCHHPRSAIGIMCCRQESQDACDSYCKWRAKQKVVSASKGETNSHAKGKKTFASIIQLHVFLVESSDRSPRTSKSRNENGPKF